MVPVWPPGPGGSPVINLHGAGDHLVNEMWTYSGLYGSAERTRMELREQSEEKSVAAAGEEKEVGAWLP